MLSRRLRFLWPGFKGNSALRLFVQESSLEGHWHMQVWTLLPWLPLKERREQSWRCYVPIKRWSLFTSTLWWKSKASVCFIRAPHWTLKVLGWRFKDHGLVCLVSLFSKIPLQARQAPWPLLPLLGVGAWIFSSCLSASSVTSLWEALRIWRKENCPKNWSTLGTSVILSLSPDLSGPWFKRWEERETLLFLKLTKRTVNLKYRVDSAMAKTL